MRWQLSWRADPRARELADRHYNRQKPGAPQFVPPGKPLVLLTPDAGALWVSHAPIAEYVKHRWAGAWMCTLFRNERPDLYRSSELIAEALAATLARWGAPPALGMVTFVDPRKTRRKRDPGRCFLRAGFAYVPCERCAGTGVVALSLRCPACGGDGRARTLEEGLLALQIRPAAMPPPADPIGAQVSIFDRPGPKLDPQHIAYEETIWHGGVL